MTQSQNDLIARIDAALVRLSAYDTPLAETCKARLAAKKTLVASGHYEVVDVTASCIAGVGAQIGLFTKAYLT